VNDFVLEVFRRVKRKKMNSVPELMFAGATAGMCQVSWNPFFSFFSLSFSLYFITQFKPLPKR
jgi:hypothetical protein